MSSAASIHAKVVELGKHVLRMTTEAGSGHPTSSLSIMHIVVTLMYRQMRWDPANPWNLDADRLVLSEGHAVPAVYAAYADLGGAVCAGSPLNKTWKPNEKCPTRKLTVDELGQLRAADSVLDGHPNPAEGVPFFDAATGSLGQGLSVAAGLGLAARLSGSPRHVYVIIGDGESREGQNWEAADFIVDQKLANVTAIFNCNGQGQADYVSPQQSGDQLAAKLAAFGWEVLRVDGHDPDALAKVFTAAAVSTRATAVVAKTQKGWGVDLIKARTNHGKPVAKAELAAAMAQLDSTAAELGVGDAKLTTVPAMPVASTKAFAATGKLPSFADGMAAAGLAGAVAKNQVATRRAYGAALLALGAADERVVSLDADVSNSTFAEMFGHKYPERFFECKIAEQNMISAAVGLAAAGRVPFASTFAKFFSRAYDQIEMASITRANIKLVGSHAGISLAADGPSQMGLPDVAFFRSFADVDAGGMPACISLHPSDAVAAYQMTHLMARHVGMCYMRTHRPEVAILYPHDQSFDIGGVHVLERGDAVAIVSAGYMVHVCREAVMALRAKGVKCSLVDAYSLPMRPDALLAAGASCGQRYLCVEDNYDGGMGSVVAEIVAASGSGRAEVMTVHRLPKSGRTPEDLLQMTNLSTAQIIKRATEMLK